MATIEITPEIGELEQALAELWRQADATVGDDTLMRALTLNLIAVTDAEHERDLREAIERLLNRHPCRVFLLSVDDAALELTANLKAQTIDQQSCCQMVLEQLTIHTNPGDFPRLPSMIRPLLVNDIPVHLFWARPLPKKIWHLDALAEMADLVVFDATLLGDTDYDRRDELQHLRMVDLAWLRLRPWRRVLAETFEHVAFDATATTNIRIEHRDHAPARNTCHLLANWLEERLGNRAHVQLQASRQSDLPDNQPTHIEVVHQQCRIDITHMLTEPCLRALVTLEGSCLMPTIARSSAGHRGDLLAAAVDV